MITGYKNTRCGLIGEKLGHSFSPQIHKELSDYSYDLFEMKEEEVGNFLQSNKFDATNVTIPYKKTVMPFLDAITDEALRIGSVNTIVRQKDNTLKGYNTDYYGFLYMVKKSGIEILDRSVLILGTGGASLTAKTVCEDLGAANISFVSRTGEINYQNVYDICSGTQVIVNCTPVGMYPKNGISPIDLERFQHCVGVIDMIYNPAKTQLLLDAERLSIPHINGLYMLVAQAKKACELFLSQEIDDNEIDRITNRIAASTGNIILVGMPGCGKTTVGKILASMAGRDVIDTDEMIYNATKRTPAEIIKSDGEIAFRAIEHIEVCNAGKQSSSIISTGGGVVTREENYLPLRQNGTVFFIHRSLEKLETKDRPLSQSTALSALYGARLPLYRKFCDYEVSNDTSPEECAESILKLFNKENQI